MHSMNGSAWGLQDVADRTSMEIKCLEADNEEKDNTIPWYVKLLKLFVKGTIPNLAYFYSVTPSTFSLVI